MTDLDVPLVGSGSLRIPVRNLWLLYLYASDLYGLLDADERVEAETQIDQLDMLAARILVHEVAARCRETLTPGYQARQEVLASVRGRIDHLATARGGHLAKGRVACRFDEFTSDTPRNRYVLEALRLGARRLSQYHGTAAKSVAVDCLRWARVFEDAGVTQHASSQPPVLRETLGPSDRADRRMVAAARLLLQCTTPSFESGALWVRQLSHSDDHHLRRLFEAGVRGFYAANLEGWEVRPVTMHWPGDVSAGSELWPTMRTDITVDSPQGRRLVIDTKFTTALTAPTPHHPVRLRTSHLYQLATYLTSQDIAGGETERRARGLLLYPSTAPAPFIETWRNFGEHRLGVATVDMAAPQLDIRDRLLGLVELGTSADESVACGTPGVGGVPAHS